jgi:hypothetical protein
LIIIRVWGGLGNQMFQYALMRAFEHEGIECKLDLSYYSWSRANSVYELERVFGLKPSIATDKECKQLADYRMNYWHRIKKRLFPKKTHFIQSRTGNIGYDESVLKKKMAYLEGYFQSEAYFSSIEEKIRNEFDFIEPLNSKSKDMVNFISSVNSASLHVRRGDYLRYMEHSAPLSVTSYYQHCVEKLTSEMGKLDFFVFSNDPQWCKKTFDSANYHIVDWNGGAESWQDMYLMSRCSHNIIANSTFSWWGAWLNKNIDKIVCAPNEWMPEDGFLYKQLVPDSWMRVSR